MKKIVKIGAAFLAATLVSLLFGGCGSVNLGGISYEHADRYTAGDASFTGAITALEVEWPTGDVSLSTGETAETTVAETANRELTEETRVHTWLDGSTLHVKFAASGLHGMFVDLKKSLSVVLPQGTDLKELQISCASASLTVKAVSAEKAVLDSASGSVKTNELTADVLKINTASGSVSGSVTVKRSADVETASGSVRLDLQAEEAENVHIKTASGAVDTNVFGKTEEFSAETSSGKINAVLAEKVERLKAESASGKISLDLCGVSSADVETASGDITLVLPADAAFTADVDTASGRFSCEFAVTMEKKDRYVCGAGTAKLELETASGDIAIKKAQ